MARKLKSTGFGRFLLFMIFLIPIAYLGAAYLNGEDGVGKLKNMLSGEETTAEVVSTANTSVTTDLEVTVEALKNEIDIKKERIEELEEENATLREKLNEMSQEKDL